MGHLEVGDSEDVKKRGSEQMGVTEGFIQHAHLLDNGHEASEHGQRNPQRRVTSLPFTRGNEGTQDLKGSGVALKHKCKAERVCEIQSSGRALQKNMGCIAAMCPTLKVKEM